MKCPVCGKEYEGSECPVCKCPNIRIVGDYEEGLKQLEPTLNEYRKKYLGTYKIGVKIIKKKDNDFDTAVPAVLYFGTANELQGIEKWLANKIVYYPNKDNSLNVEVAISSENGMKYKTVQIKDVKGPSIINVGIRFTDANTFCIKVRDDGGILGISQSINIGED